MLGIYDVQEHENSERMVASQWDPSASARSVSLSYRISKKNSRGNKNQTESTGASASASVCTWGVRTQLRLKQEDSFGMQQLLGKYRFCRSDWYRLQAIAAFLFLLNGRLTRLTVGKCRMTRENYEMNEYQGFVQLIASKGLFNLKWWLA